MLSVCPYNLMLEHGEGDVDEEPTLLGWKATPIISFPAPPLRSYH